MTKKQTSALSKSLQYQAFVKAAREAGCSEDEAVFDENLKKIARHKPVAGPSPKPLKKPCSK